jgi:hypothetical protein
MMVTSPQLKHELEDRILARTSRRVRNLAVELRPEGVVLRGDAASYYIKQLAQHGVRDVLPHVSLQNAITVEKTSSLVG